MKKILFIILTLISSSAYGQVYDDHVISYKDGNAIYMNQKNGFTIGVSKTKVGGNIKITFAFINNTGEAVNILHENISAEYVNKKGENLPIEIRTYEDVRRKERNKVLWFGPDNKEIVNAKTEVKNEYGLVIGSVDTKAEVYTGKADEAYEKVEEQMQDYLRSNTLFDGQQLKGYVLIKKPKAKTFSLEIKIGKAIYKYVLPVE